MQMWRQLLYALGLVAQIGLIIVFSAGIGWWGGAYLDQHFTHGYVLSVIGMFLGVISGFITVYRLLMRGFGNGGGLGNG